MLIYLNLEKNTEMILIDFFNPLDKTSKPVFLDRQKLELK